MSESLQSDNAPATAAIDSELETILTSFDSSYAWNYASVKEGLCDLNNALGHSSRLNSQRATTRRARAGVCVCGCVGGVWCVVCVVCVGCLRVGVHVYV